MIDCEGVGPDFESESVCEVEAPKVPLPRKTKETVLPESICAAMVALAEAGTKLVEKKPEFAQSMLAAVSKLFTEVQVLPSFPLASIFEKFLLHLPVTVTA